MLFCVGTIFWYEFLLEETTQHSCNPTEVDSFFIENIWDTLMNQLIATMWINVCQAILPSSATSTSSTSLVHLGLLDVHLECLYSSLVLPACFLFLKRCDAQMDRTLWYHVANLINYFRINYLSISYPGSRKCLENIIKCLLK